MEERTTLQFLNRVLYASLWMIFYGFLYMISVELTIIFFVLHLLYLSGFFSIKEIDVTQ